MRLGWYLPEAACVLKHTRNRLNRSVCVHTLIKHRLQKKHYSYALTANREPAVHQKKNLLSQHNTVKYGNNTSLKVMQWEGSSMWRCGLNMYVFPRNKSHMLTTLTLRYTFIISFQAQNSPFPQIFSTIVC